MKKTYSVFTAVMTIAVMLSQVTYGKDGIGLWASAGLEKKIVKGTDLGLEAEYRLADNLSTFDRWSAGLTLSTRLYRNFDKTITVKAAAGYKYLRVLNPETIKYKGESDDIPDNRDLQYYFDGEHDFNYTCSYYENRHRFTASLQSSYEVSRFRFSLRESYQFTCSDSVEVGREIHRFVERYDPESDDFVSVHEPNDTTTWKSGMNKHVLRSRIGVEYNIPHWKFDPFISMEFFNRIDKGWTLAKTRLTAGIEFTLAKKHDFQIAFVRQNRSDEDEPACSALCISYKYNF
ncbi:MAG: DUF2490 domain-containing protein [Bacteroidaceae bacterium]|nr:DUF2490 domain-containing protein [Bacteroidaceae bacterium]